MICVNVSLPYLLYIYKVLTYYTGHVEALPVVQITPPPKDGAGNSHNFVIETYTKTEVSCAE